MVEEKKSYFFVLSEDKECSASGKELLAAFRKFEKAHCNDSEIRFLTPDDQEFGRARNLFGIRQTPAFVIADEPQKLEKGENPFISFNRPAFEELPGENIINLITDIHYLLIDEDLLRVKRRVAETWVLNLFRKMWSELKDFVNVSIG